MAELALPTQPVHVLDYAFFLPAAMVTALMALRRRPFAYPVVASFLVFLLLTCLPILLTPVLQVARDQPASWGASIPIGVLAVALLGQLVWLLSTVRAGGPGPTSPRPGSAPAVLPHDEHVPGCR